MIKCSPQLKDIFKNKRSGQLPKKRRINRIVLFTLIDWFVFFWNGNCQPVFAGQTVAL